MFVNEKIGKTLALYEPVWSRSHLYRGNHLYCGHKTTRESNKWITMVRPNLELRISDKTVKNRDQTKILSDQPKHFAKNNACNDVVH